MTEGGDLVGAGAGAEYSGDLAQARQFFQGRIGQSSDFRYRNIRLGPKGPAAMLVYLEGMIDGTAVDEQILQPAMQNGPALVQDLPNAARTLEQSLTSRAAVRRTSDLRKAERGVLDAQTCLIVDGCPELLLLGVQKFPQRAIEKPSTEHSVRGSREAFTEVLMTNLTLVRRRVKDPNLRVKALQVGSRSQTWVAVCYIEKLTNPAVVEEVLRRLKRIRIDGLQGVQTLEEFLVDHPSTPFPLLRSTERPDEVARQLLSGKVVILADNSPFSLSAPSVLLDFYQTMDDYHFGFWGASMIRLVRFIGWLLTLYLPAVYIALIAVNPEMLPHKLALTVAAAREGLPFPPIMEVLVIEVLLELIREAALRLPQPLGTTIGVVGGIVVGEAIVSAGLISPLMIIFAATTMLASFTSPTLDVNFAWRLMKWLLIALAQVFGLMGIIVGSVVLFGHLAALTSFGVPYLAPVAPLTKEDLGDTIVRLPYWALRFRPRHLRPLDRRRAAAYDHPVQTPDLEGAQREGEER